MKKTIIKLSVFLAVFIVSLIAAGRIMNQGHDNLTMELAEATYPIVTMERNGIAYNQLHGYREAMETAFQRDTVTVLNESRSTDFTVDTYGRNITGISIEVRSTDGQRLIEDTPVTDYQTDGEQIYGTISLKDLIEKDTEYSLAVVLEVDEDTQLRYYTRALWSDSSYVDEKLAFVTDFHERLYDRTAAEELTKYLETDSSLEDNSSFHKVNIHSSFRQITWGDLPVEEVGEPVVSLKEIASQTASILINYMVCTSGEEETVYYQVEEYYRVRYTTDRMYVLDYERTMTQIPDVQNMYANNKILLGITDENVPMVESGDGNVVVFLAANQLFSYNVTNNKLTVIFSFYDENNRDARTLYGEHSIKILDVDEGGNVAFAVYGYMNRGRHEGQVGIQIYNYDNSLNTIEELIYIPYQNSYAVLAAEMERLLYLSRDQKLYLSLDNIVYEINLEGKTYSQLVHISQDDSMQVSENHKIIVWMEGEDFYHGSRLHIKNLGNGTESEIAAEAGDAILPLGFMGEDVIYGIARREDVTEDSSGSVFFPMYCVRICNSQGEPLMEYAQDNIYVTGCTVRDNQITLDRVIRLENGAYETVAQDQIMNNVEPEQGKNVVVAADIDIYERYVQIQTRNTIDSSTIQILTPKEMVFEGGRELALPSEQETARYYVYGPYGVEGIYSLPSRAVNLAYDMAGVVVDNSGSIVWLRGNRVTRNQIMAITEESVTEERGSLAVCLDTMLEYEGIIRNAEYLLSQGQTALDILQENLPDAQILDLTGCSLDAVLYYVNQDIPVLAMLENGEAVLITGFNEYNVVIMEPSTGRLYQNGMNDTTQWLSENGNRFITYMRVE